MPAKIIDGKQVAQSLKDRVKQDIHTRLEGGKTAPGLAVILVGTDPASQVYVKHKISACEAVGIQSTAHHLGADTKQSDISTLIDELNQDPSVHGILLQLPLPEHLNSEPLLEQISPTKDVDGFHPYNIGRLAQRIPSLRPCTPMGIMMLLESTGVTVKGKDALIVGASNIVGRPMGLELLLAGATVTTTHRFTMDLPKKVAQADIVIVAAGKPGLVKGDWIKPGSIVIDVGINRLQDGKLVGDIEFETARERASWITPVPGGVGPMTVACLMYNTLLAAQKTALTNS